MSADEAGEEIGAYDWSPDMVRKLIALPIFDKLAYGQLGGRVFDARYVQQPALRIIAEEVYGACTRAQGQPPTPEFVRDLVRERTRQRVSPALAEMVRQELELVLTADVSDARLLRSRAATWARVEALIQSMEQARSLIEHGLAHNGQGTRILHLFQEALAVGKGSEACLRLVRERDKVAQELAYIPRRTPTGFAAVDRALGGGAEAGLHLIAGDPKLGKTSFLTQVAVGAVRRGHTVFYVSGEVALRPLTRRFVSAMTGWSKAEVRENPLGAARLLRAYQQSRGEIVVEYAPAFTAEWVASRVRQLEGQGLRFGVVICDYVDIMNMSGVEYAERRFTLSKICRDLRDLGIELNIPCWSAKGVNRRAVEKPIVTKADLSECFDVGYVADNIFALCATARERENVKRVGTAYVPTPILRVFFAAGRESQDEYQVAAYERDNDRQCWRELPGYLDRFLQQAAGEPPATSTGGVA